MRGLDARATTFSRLLDVPGALPERAHRDDDVVEAAVPVVEERNRRALELRLQIDLAAVGDDEVGPAAT